MQQQVQTAQGIGALLRRARERRGTSLQDAARDTCISIAYLGALERGEPYSAFPAPVYARGFLREYARYLGLDPAPLVDRFWEGEEVPDPVIQASMAHSPRMPDRGRGVLRGLRPRPR